MKIILALPVPPSLNALFPTFKGRRIKSKKYKEWQNEAQMWIDTQFIGQKPRIDGKVRILYGYMFKDKRKRDIANFEKAVSDFLVSSGFINDDSDIDLMELVRLRNEKPNLVYVEIEVYKENENRQVKIYIWIKDFLQRRRDRAQVLPHHSRAF